MRFTSFQVIEFEFRRRTRNTRPKRAAWSGKVFVSLAVCRWWNKCGNSRFACSLSKSVMLSVSMHYPTVIRFCFCPLCHGAWMCLVCFVRHCQGTLHHRSESDSQPFFRLSFSTIVRKHHGNIPHRHTPHWRRRRNAGAGGLSFLRQFFPDTEETHTERRKPRKHNTARMLSLCVRLGFWSSLARFCARRGNGRQQAARRPPPIAVARQLNDAHGSWCFASRIKPTLSSLSLCASRIFSYFVFCLSYQVNIPIHSFLLQKG